MQLYKNVGIHTDHGLGICRNLPGPNIERELKGCLKIIIIKKKWTSKISDYLLLYQEMSHLLSW